MEFGGKGGTATTTGPRAKCDQVVFEAIAKACEIIVLSRKGGTGNYNSRQSLSSSSPSSGRFNLQIPEIRAVRKVLSQFKCSLHVPLRLDVYYQHQSSNTNGNNSCDDSSEVNNNSNGGGRELLERWCLEYAPCHSTYFTDECNNLDPIIQLRHVCKKIVLWLRTLYCTSKLLPCGNATSTCSDKRHIDRIGFSIYVSDESQYHDVEDLIRNTGFQQQGHSSVYTPYGRLDLSCVYATQNSIRNLFPRQPTARWVSSTPTKPTPTTLATSQNTNQFVHMGLSPNIISPHSAARPIPTQNTTQKIYSSSKSIKANGRHDKQDFAPQSAPSHLSIIQNYTSSPRHHNYQPKEEQQQLLATTAPRPGIIQEKHENLMAQHHHRGDSAGRSRPSYLRAHSSSEYDQRNHHGLVEESPKEKKRVLSGLSLAMMNAEEDEEESNEIPPEPSDAEDCTNDVNTDTAKSEQRRAALHQPPPTAGVTSHFPTSTMAATPPNHQQHRHHNQSHPIQAEYGYAYNNNILWGHGNHQASSNPSRVSPMDGESAGAFNAGGIHSGSPGTPLLSATPPQPMFVGSMNRSPFTPSLKQMANLIPPARKSSIDSVTPPFTALPTTLMEAPQAPAMEYTACINSRHEQQQQQQQNQQQNQLSSTTSQHVLPPISSLDLLHMSPFKAQQNQQGSVLSSLSGNVGGMGSELYLSKISPHESSFRGNMTSSNLDNQDEDDMPFAVDEATPSMPFASSGASQVGTTSLMANSAIGINLDASTASAAVMAHKCATAGRLKLFDSQVVEDARDLKQYKLQEQNQEILREESEPENEERHNIDPVISSLADQLADFRSFGASLALPPANTVTSDHGSVSGSGAASTSTPIPLKT